MKHLSERRTEDVALELLTIQGWPTERPKKGRLVRQNEYKAFPALRSIFEGKSKRGSGDAYPDFLLLAEDHARPELIVETKSSADDLPSALDDAIHYGEACRTAGHSVILVGVAGQEKTGTKVRVLKYDGRAWLPVTYHGHPISWIPTPEDTRLLTSSAKPFDLSPVVPSHDILAAKAEEINRILREAHVKDEFRPAAMGAMMLALWAAKGNLRRDAQWVLRDINTACRQAFQVGGKTELAESLRVEEANANLAANAWRILAILEQLNVVNASFAHDYLGQLYEAFFRYTGGNTIGQYFTPRHITRFMADICEVTRKDVVIDPACGTGGFLIACIHRAMQTAHPPLKYEAIVEMVKGNLVGFESEPVTAALCVANMILRGDGKTGIHKHDCFGASGYPTGRCDIALMNPPFPHKKTDIPPEDFIDRALEALRVRGKLAVLLPTSLLVKRDKGAWRARLLERNSLLAVVQLPDELFQPYASATTSVVLLEKGVPHNPAKETLFVRMQHDGLVLKKSVRVTRDDGLNDLPRATAVILNRQAIPGFSGPGRISKDDEWSPGAYVPAATPTEVELKAGIDELMRRMGSFYTRYAAEIIQQRQALAKGILQASPYRKICGPTRLLNAKALAAGQDTLGQYFDLFYGQKELHSRDGIPPGKSLIVSPTESYNGCYGWLTFSKLVEPAFVTVAQTGSIGEAFVQNEPCGVNDDCLILLPKEGTDLPRACLYIAAAIIRLERWRFSYGRKLTPLRISGFRMPRHASLETWVEQRLKVWDRITADVLSAYE